MSKRPSIIERSTQEGPGAASRTLAAFIFASRWLQAPLYLGLIVAQAIYVVLFLVELWHLFENVIISGRISETDVMLSVLALIDIVMIANLLIMVIVGGYETFVSKINLEQHPDQPEWLSHVNANVLKVKLAMAIVGISSIHLLKTFIEVTNMKDGVAAGLQDGGHGGGVTAEGAFWQVVIHVTFILSALALAWIDRMQITADAKARLAAAEVAKLEAEAAAIETRLPRGERPSERTDEQPPADRLHT